MTREIHSCPSCGFEDVSRNGHTRHGKQNYKCRDCGRQFVVAPQWQVLSEEQKGLIERLLQGAHFPRGDCTSAATVRGLRSTLRQPQSPASVATGGGDPGAKKAAPHSADG